MSSQTVTRPKVVGRMYTKDKELCVGDIVRAPHPHGSTELASILDVVNLTWVTVAFVEGYVGRYHENQLHVVAQVIV